MALIAPQCGRLGERVVAYIDLIGRLEGIISRIFPSGFSMTIAASQRKRDKLAAQLTWLANRHILDLPEDRRHQRVAMRDQTATLVMEDGGQEHCRVVDLSVSGVAVISENWAPDRLLCPGRQGAGPRGPSPGQRLRGRVHPHPERGRVKGRDQRNVSPAVRRPAARGGSGLSASTSGGRCTCVPAGRLTPCGKTCDRGFRGRDQQPYLNPRIFSRILSKFISKLRLICIDFKSHLP